MTVHVKDHSLGRETCSHTGLHLLLGSQGAIRKCFTMVRPLLLKKHSRRRIVSSTHAWPYPFGEERFGFQALLSDVAKSECCSRALPKLQVLQV